MASLKADCHVWIYRMILLFAVCYTDRVDLYINIMIYTCVLLICLCVSFLYRQSNSLCEEVCFLFTVTVYFLFIVTGFPTWATIITVGCVSTFYTFLVSLTSQHHEIAINYIHIIYLFYIYLFIYLFIQLFSLVILFIKILLILLIWKGQSLKASTIYFYL
jgi:hypothetical protein